MISTTVADRFGNPVPGYTPTFDVTEGNLTVNGVTDDDGVVTATLRSTTVLTTATISVTGLITVTPVSVDFIVGPVYTASMEASPTSI